MSETPAKIPIAHRKKARNLLVQALYQWQLAQSPAPSIEAQFRADNTGKIDWDFFQQALNFVTENCGLLDDSFSSLLDRELESITPVELAILRLASFELIERIDVPYRVVINEYIDLAKKYGATDSHKFVNGVLDKAAHKQRQTEIKARQ